MQTVVYPCALARIQKTTQETTRCRSRRHRSREGRYHCYKTGLRSVHFQEKGNASAGIEGRRGRKAQVRSGGRQEGKKRKMVKVVVMRSQVDFWALRQPEAAPPNVKNSVDYMTKGLWLVVKAISHPILPASSPANLDKLYYLKESFQGSITFRGKIR